MNGAAGASAAATGWVVKLGGSLLGTSTLSAWLHALAAPDLPALVIVPGGGSFADQVRREQPRLRFGEAAAHAMAILAMAQVAEILHGLRPDFVLASDADAASRLARPGRPVVWRALDVAGPVEGLAPGWDLTSDGLSLWLAGRLGWPAAMLVKSCEVPPGATLQELAGAGIVDARSPAIAARTGTAAVVVPAADLPAALGRLRGTADPVG